MRRATAVLGVLFLLLAPATADAAPKWLAPRVLAEVSGSPPDVAVAPSGAAIVAYLEQNTSGTDVKVMYRPAGGGFGDPQTIGSETHFASPQVAIDDGGRAVVVFTEGSLRYRTFTPGSGWGTPQVLGAAPSGGTLVPGDLAFRNDHIAVTWATFAGSTTT